MSFSSTTSTSNWLKFFTNAGLPSSTAADYAHIFVKNRMQMNMLEEITKDYLREMNITVMGDIISILRHAKLVREQLARDKILTIKSDDKIPIASVPAKPKLISIPSATITIDDPPKIRRVLPEHEGKYKIIHPTGSTSRSKEILAKKSQMQADLMNKKSSIFDRLNANNDVEMIETTPTTDQVIKIVGLRGSESSMKQPASIFNRLGSKKPTESEIEEKSIAFAGILKNSPTKKTSPRGIVKAKVSNQKVLFVKKVPTKIATDSDDSDDSESDRHESDNYKSVSFSPEVEVVEIAPRKVSKNLVKPNHIKGLRTDGIKSRLGLNSPADTFKTNSKKNVVKLKPSRLGAHSSSDAFIHSTKKVVKMKVSSPKVTSTSMIADGPISKASVHQRLSLQNQSSTSQLTSRIKRFSLDAVPTSSTDHKKSVFSRLGINK